MPKAQVNPDEHAIREFLENVLDRDWFHLLQANPRTSGIGTMSGTVTDSTDDAVEWLLARAKDKRNCYYSVNCPPRTRSKKARKTDLEWIDFAHVDVDIPKDMRRDDPKADDFIADKKAEIFNQTLIPGCPHIIASGNGVQALWPLAKPLKATEANIERVETINRRLAAAFGGDSCHNIERVLRVPGTPNFPDEGKRKRGYTVRLAELVAVTRDLFTLEDFDGLPKVKAAAVARTASRVDYTAKNYSQGYEPYSFEDFFKQRADVVEVLKEKQKDVGEDDRSPVCYSLIHLLLNFLMNERDCTAVSMLDNVDVMKNIAEMFLEGAEKLSIIEEIAERYFESKNRYGLGSLGYDIQNAMNTAADEHRRATQTSKKRARDRVRSAELASTPLAEITPDEAWTAFMGHVFNSMSDHSNLPNFREKAASQSSTQANVRAILNAAGIVVRWDVMRDQARFHVRPDAGQVDQEGHPAALWERALSRVRADGRARAEEMLMCDSVELFGLRARKDLPELFSAIAQEDFWHPIEDYCKARKWDGLDRIAELAKTIDTDHPLVEVYLRQHFRCCVAAVKSMRNYIRTGDGLQIDTAVILDGAQGIGKSRFWNMMTPDGFRAGGQSLRLGKQGEVDSKRECLAGLVCVLNEIAQTYSRSEADVLKDFRTATRDEFRVAYGRAPTIKPRMTVFCGTSNALLLHDHTGTRRDLVMKVFGFDFAAIEELLDNGGLQQIYAEAWHEVMVEGEVWWLAPDQEKVRAQYNEGHAAVSEDEMAISSYLDQTGDMHTPQWMTATQICKQLGLRYVPARSAQFRAIMEKEGCAYRDSIRYKGKHLRRVFSWPILPDQYKLCTEG